MDALDMRLVRAMGTEPFEQGARHPDALRPARLAEAVGTTRQTVEARLARLEERGIVRGYRLHPNLRHLGLQRAIYHYKAPDVERARRCFEAVEPEGGVAGVYAFLTPDVCVDLHWSSDEERATTVARLAALAESPPFTLYAREMPRVPRPLTPLDWRIVWALRADARRPVEDVAADVGVSVRTVRRHLERMVRENGVDVVPVVAFENMPRSVPLAFLFHFTPDGGKATAAALLQLFDDRCVSAWVPPSAALGNYDMTVVVESAGEIEALRRRTLAVPGVRAVDTLLYTAARVDATWLDRLLERKAAEASAA